jgi:hypothetical protein
MKARGRLEVTVAEEREEEVDLNVDADGNTSIDLSPWKLCPSPETA